MAKYLIQHLPPGGLREDGWIVLDIVRDREQAQAAAERARRRYPDDEVRVVRSDRYP